MQLVNLTPHPIVLRSGEVNVTVPPSGTVARVSSTPGQVLPIEGVPVPVHASPAWGALEGLPEPVPGTLFIVSALVAARCAHRGDVVCPGTGPADWAVRDDAGRIIAVTRLVAASAGEVAS